ncbi:hypothetical protein CEXT_449351 [Caerostris extrusa]|uniref:Uncharacterized protein n=1 Tax=Caerostris extrusa TaxID=172846 RepID=A0AAV4UX73_CAEEX|nr:hypothetical protein CEXT_449351 [Caerostris extrusa]
MSSSKVQQDNRGRRNSGPSGGLYRRMSAFGAEYGRPFGSLSPVRTMERMRNGDNNVRTSTTDTLSNYIIFNTN